MSTLVRNMLYVFATLVGMYLIFVPIPREFPAKLGFVVLFIPLFFGIIGLDNKLTEILKLLKEKPEDKISSK